jgi:hypothetical protein
MGYVEREVFYPTKEGTPQGRPPKKPTPNCKFML